MVGEVRGEQFRAFARQRRYHEHNAGRRIFAVPFQRLAGIPDSLGVKTGGFHEDTARGQRWHWCGWVCDQRRDRGHVRTGERALHIFDARTARSPQFEKKRQRDGDDEPGCGGQCHELLTLGRRWGVRWFGAVNDQSARHLQRLAVVIQERFKNAF